MKILIFSLLLNFVTASYDKSIYDAKSGDFIIPDDKEGFMREVEVRRGRILYGNDAPASITYPYAVELNVRWRNGIMDTCSGAILSTSYIITARECIFDDRTNLTAATIMMQAGASCRCQPRTAIFTQWGTWIDRTDGQLPHPNFGLALLSQFIVTSPTIQPIRLPTFAQSFSWFDMMPSFIIGWGMTQTGWDDILQHGRVIITARGQNNQNFVPGISEYELLARAAPEFFGMMLGYGDQGGPMIINEGGTHTLIGTLWTNRQYNDGTLSEKMITAFRIGHFWDFIHDITGIPRRF